MKLKVKDIDFEALIKDLPMSNPFHLVYETSNIYNVHGNASLEGKCNENVKDLKQI